MKNNSLTYIEEPELTFGNNQTAMDPRDGLLLFGAYEKFSNNSIKVGFIGRKEGLNYYMNFVEILQSPLISKKIIYGNEIEIESQRPNFPGFEATFEVEWPKNLNILLS